MLAHCKACDLIFSIPSKYTTTADHCCTKCYGRLLMYHPPEQIKKLGKREITILERVAKKFNLPLPEVKAAAMRVDDVEIVAKPAKLAADRQCQYCHKRIGYTTFSKHVHCDSKECEIKAYTAFHIESPKTLSRVLSKLIQRGV